MVRDEVSAAMDSLVANRGAGEPYNDLDEVCTYFQWTVDHVRFEEESKNYLSKLEAENSAMVDQAREEFRHKNAMTRERVLWGWCPFWRVLEANKSVLDQLPPLPWSHNSKYNTVKCLWGHASVSLHSIMWC